MRFLRSFLFRLYGECFTRRGRRRLGRRLATRFLLLFVAIAWTYPFVSAFWDEQLVDFRLLDFWSRRFDVEVPPCPGSC